MSECYECGAAALVESRETVPYKALPGVMLANIRVETCSACGDRSVTIPVPGQLNKLLTEMLVLKPARLTPVEIRFLRKALGWSGTDLAAALRVHKSTVSRWENGHQPIELSNEMLLRSMAALRAPVESFAEEHRGAAAVDAAPLSLEIAHSPAGWGAAA